MSGMMSIKKACMVAVIICFTAFPIVVRAEDGYQLQQITVHDAQVVAYIAGEERPEKIDYQIAMTPCDNAMFGTVNEMGETVHTIILMDNSLSITEENREKALDFLRQYVQTGNANEEISLAVFGEDIQFLVRRSADAEELLFAIDSIEFNNQDTYLTDILYDLLDEIKEETAFTRFIVVSDGVDNKAIGITKEELTDKLKDNLHPVYAVGHVYKENQTELENMFALSRITHGNYFLLDDIEDTTDLISQLAISDNLYCIKVKVPEELCDGSTRNSLITAYVGDNEYEVTAQVTMSFSIKTEEPELEPVEEPEPEPVEKPKPEPVEEPVVTEKPEPIVAEEKPEKEEDDDLTMKLLAAVVVVTVGIVVYVLLNRKGTKDRQVGKKDKVKKKNEPVQSPTPVVQLPVQEFVDADATVLLDGRYLLVMRDQKSSEKIFRYPMDSKVIVGRNVDKVNIAIDYSKTVSGQHCEFYVRNNRFFVRDLQSANHTYLNDVMICAETELTSGSVVRIGEVEFYVEFVPI